MANPKVTFDFKADISQINQAIQKIDQRLDKFGGKAKQQTEGFAGGMARFGLAVSGVQQAFGMLDQTIGAVARKVEDIGGNFEHNMNKVKAVSGATGEQFEKMRDSALEFGSSTARSASEVGKLQFELSKLGFKPEEIIKSTEGILNMSIAFDVDLARSAEVAGGVLRQFGLDASEAGNVADIMATAFSSTALDTEKFANAMVYVGQIAPQAGFKMHEVTSLLGVLSNKMVDSSIAGTALTKIMEQMANPQSDLTKEIGHTVSGYDGFVEVMQHMKNSGKDLTDFLGFVLPRTAKTFGVLVDSANDIDKLTKSLEGVSGASKNMADIMMQDLIGAQVELDSAVEGLWVRIATQLTPAMMRWKETQTEFVKSIDEEEIRSYALALGLVATGFAIIKREAVSAIFKIKAVKIAMASTGWGLAVVAITAVVGALIDFSGVLSDNTEELEDNADQMEENKRRAEELARASEDIQSLSGHEEVKKRYDLEKKILTQEKERERLMRAVFNAKKREGTYASDTLKYDREDYKIINDRLQALIDMNKEQKRQIIEGEKMQNASDEKRLVVLGGYDKWIKWYIQQQQQLLAWEGLTYDQVLEARDEQEKKVQHQEKVLAIAKTQLAIEVSALETQIQSTATSKEKLKVIDNIQKAQNKADINAMRDMERMDKKIKRADDDKWQRKKNSITDEVNAFILSMNKQESIAKLLGAELQKIHDTDKTLTDERRAEILQQIEDQKNAELVAQQAVIDANNYAESERQKIVKAEKEDDAKKLARQEEAWDAMIMNAYERGIEIQGVNDELDDRLSSITGTAFDRHIDYLDKKIEAEEIYSEKWFQLMDHRQQKYDEHMQHQIDTGRMTTAEQMAETAKLLEDDTITAERKMELEEQMAQQSLMFYESGANFAKDYAKKEAIAFITSQQVKLIAKLAEILAQGATTFGTSLIYQLPMYAGAVAILEKAKAKVMAMAVGGVVDSPTLTLLGEAGPELVIPEQGFKDYVKEQIIPYQAQALGVPLSEFTNQNFIQNSVNMNRQEQLTEINTTAIKKMSGEIGLLSKTMNQPQGVTITDGSTIINAEMERGRLN